MTEADNARLRTAVVTCRRHIVRMRSAVDVLGPLMPLTEASLPQLDEASVRATDQFVYRFGKLQDAAGGQLFPSILAALEEPYRQQSMRDRLNRLEQLGIVPELDEWQRVRATRNRLTHEYPDEPARQAAVLNRAWGEAPLLEQIVDRAITESSRLLS